MPVLIPSATLFSATAKSKTARAIHHQSSCPITGVWNKKYAPRAIKTPVCAVS